MIRKITLLLLLCIGCFGAANAQTEDSVQIYLPWGSDTTCPGSQLTFIAIESNDTAVGSTFKWYVNGVYTGVSIDTFITTAVVDGDVVDCEIFFTNSGGFLDSAMSNPLTVHRSSAIMPAVMISIIAGSNPDCPGHPLTFQAYPATGGTAPLYQWRVDGVDVAGATSSTYTNIFNDGDTVSCMMVSNSPCAFPTDTAYSNGIEVIHDSLTATLGISLLYNPLCAGTHDTFTAVTTDAGLGSTIYWFVNGTLVPGALGPNYNTDTLHNGDIVYAMLVAPDACVINDTTISTPITVTVFPNQNPLANIVLTHGANPGCIDSAITYTASFSDGGVAPDLIWLVNDVPVATGSATHTQAYANGDLLTFRLRTTDGGCYTHDSFTTPAVLMVRDSTPVAPLISLIDNMLVANTAGTYIWYFNGVVIPGANGQNYHPGAMGFYTAVRDTGNCHSKLSNVIYISLLKVGEIAGSAVRIYPNPTSGIVTLDFGSTLRRAQLSVSNIVGQVVLAQDISNKQRHDADLSHLPAGNYIISVRDEDGGVSTHKVMLEK